MKIVIVSGSSRASSQSLKISKVIQGKLIAMQHNIDLVDLHTLSLPMYNGESQPTWDEVKPKLEQAEAFVWVVPEWHGSAGPAIMNFVTYIGAKQTAHKPLLIVSVSSGVGGSYPIAQLKSFATKNSRLVIVPETLRFIKVESYFNNSSPQNDQDQSLHKRADYALSVLVSYAEHLSAIRQSGLIDLQAFPHGN